MLITIRAAAAVVLGVFIRGCIDYFLMRGFEFSFEWILPKGREYFVREIEVVIFEYSRRESGWILCPNWN